MIQLKSHLTISLFLLTFFLAFAAFHAQADPQNMVRKIIVFQENIVHHPAQEIIVKNAGGAVLKHLPLINGASVVLPEQALSALGTQPGILRIDHDVIVHALPAKKPPKDNTKPDNNTPPPAQVLPWGVDRIDAEVLWDLGHTGLEINIGIIDTGVDYRHPDLSANIKGGVNAISSRKDHMDDNGHGTHVAGIIGAANNNFGVVGVAPEASLYGIKALDRRGSGFLSDIIQGIDWAVNNNMHIINMSLGTNSDILSFKQACDNAAENGVILVAAAGNDGGAVDYPAAYDSVLAVAATSDDDARPYWSSFGPELFISAPGVDIQSTWKGGDYRSASGTSMAAPHLAGVLALYLQDYPEGDYINDLCAGADTLGEAIYNGCGLVDAGETLTGVDGFGNDLP